jgi:hypothetical protein
MEGEYRYSELYRIFGKLKTATIDIKVWTHVLKPFLQPQIYFIKRKHSIL